MTDLKSRLKPVFRRASTTSALKSDLSSPSTGSTLGSERPWAKSSLRLGKGRKASLTVPVHEEKELPSLPAIPPTTPLETPGGSVQKSSTNTDPLLATPPEQENPRIAVEQPTPEGKRPPTPEPKAEVKPPVENPDRLREKDAHAKVTPRPNLAARRHSPISFDQSQLFHPPTIETPPARSLQTPGHHRNRSQAYISMMQRKIWVKRPNATATQVSINEDDLVDDVKDMILRKYANSLGRNFDPPDVTLKVVLGPRSSRHTNERTLGPDENISKILDMHYPGGQTMDEALLIDVPQRRTPKHSPRIAMPYYLADDLRPGENGTDYFPPMPLAGQHSPHQPPNHSTASGHGGIHRPPVHPHTISVLETGHVPALPSPGTIGRPRHSDRAARPRYGRQHTTSPTVLTTGSSHSQNHDIHKIPSNPIAVATPPVPIEILPHRAATPPPRTSSPRPAQKPKRNKKAALNGDNHTPNPGLLDGSVPPINVLIVEDNIINLRLLEAFLKRLKVRWSTAMNGEIAVNKWREGGFHLVLMDIQLPVMNGLDATKEIRRLERVNNIGVFSSRGHTPTFEKDAIEAFGGTAQDEEEEAKPKKPKTEDNLVNIALFKSPVIIVALTASSLQSDRHEALAAGCNDFLTKPVNFDWLSRKVMEWGCMQALIDFDGWRKWKDFSSAIKPVVIDTTTPKKSTNGGAATEKVKSPKSPMMNGRVKSMLLTAGDGGTSSGGEGGEGAGSSGEGG